MKKLVAVLEGIEKQLNEIAIKLASIEKAISDGNAGASERFNASLGDK